MWRASFVEGLGCCRCSPLGHARAGGLEFCRVTAPFVIGHRDRSSANRAESRDISSVAARCVLVLYEPDILLSGMFAVWERGFCFMGTFLNPANRYTRQQQSGSVLSASASASLRSPFCNRSLSKMFSALSASQRRINGSILLLTQTSRSRPGASSPVSHLSSAQKRPLHRMATLRDVERRLSENCPTDI